MCRRALPAFLATLIAAGCGLVPTSNPFRNQLSNTITFDQTASFDNPAIGLGYFNGNWQIKDGAYQQTQASSNNFITVRRFVGNGWGNRGEAPPRYKSDVAITAYQETEARQLLGYPLGILSFIPYYRDASHYIVLVATPTNTGGSKVEAWAVNGFSPGGEAWPEDACLMSKWTDTPLSVGTPLVLGAEVDTTAQTLKVSINGEEGQALKTSLINRDKHWVAVVSNGNFVSFDNLRLFK